MSWAEAVTSVAPAAEPLVLADVKTFCRIDADDDTFDGELATLIAGVRADVEVITGTRLITQTVSLKADCFADLLRLPIGPVQSVDELTYLDAAGAEQTLVVDVDFELFGAGLTQGLRPVYGTTWPAGAIRASAIELEAVVGYGVAGANLPADLYAALLRAVRGQFDGKPIELERLVGNYRIWL